MSDITEADLDGYSDAEILGLQRAGKLDHLLAGSPAPADEPVVEEPEAKPVPNVDQGARGTPRNVGQVTAAELATMSVEEIARATRQGRMADLLS